MEWSTDFPAAEDTGDIYFLIDPDSKSPFFHWYYSNKNESQL